MLNMLPKLCGGFSDGSVLFSLHTTHIPKEKLRLQVSKIFYQGHNSRGSHLYSLQHIKGSLGLIVR